MSSASHLHLPLALLLLLTPQTAAFLIPSSLPSLSDHRASCHITHRPTGFRVARALFGGGGASEEVDCVVVGGGISGLATGLLVSKGGAKVVVTDMSGSPGGVFETREADGYMWEDGPNTFQPQDGTLAIAAEVGLAEEVVGTDPKLPRYIYKGGGLFALPSPGGPPDLSGIAGLLGPLGLIKTVIGALLPVSAPAKVDETVADFFGRTVGSEILDYVVDPFISTVYCGDPSQMSLESVFPAIARARDAAGGAGGLVRGFISSRKEAKKTAVTLDPGAAGGRVKKGASASFKGGLKALPQAIARMLGDSYRRNHECTSISFDASSSTFTTTFSNMASFSSPSVVLAVPPPQASQLIAPLSAAAAASIGQITAPAVHAVTLSYPVSSFNPEVACFDPEGGVRGFGVLIPRSEGIQTLGFQFISSLFPTRAPQGSCVLLAYYGGAQNLAAASMTADQVSAAVHSDAQKILLRPGAPGPKVLSVRKWEAGIPQYNVGHKSAVETATRALPKGLVLGGSLTGGVSIGDCVSSARRCAEEVKRMLKK